MAQLPYSDVLDRWDRARAFGETKSLPEYAGYMNDLFDTDAYSQGLRDGPWTRFSTRFDQAVQGSPVGDVFGGVGEAVGSAFGHGEAGRKVGLGLPRALLQSLPAYLLGPEAGIPATMLALGGTGTLFGAQTYAETGSAKQAAISGAAATAMPFLGKIGGNALARLAGGVTRGGAMTALDETGNITTKMFPRSVVSPNDAMSSQVNLARFFGSQSMMAATNIASTVAQNRAAGGDMSVWDAASSPEFLLGQLPWTVYDAVHMASSTTPTAEALDKVLVQPKSPTPPKPFQTKVPQDEQKASIVTAALQKLHDIAANKGDSDAIGKALAEVTEAFNNPEKVQAQKEAEGVVAAQQVKQPMRIYGVADKAKTGNYRVYVLDHDADLQGDADIRSKTVWVNGVVPTFDEKGRASFATTKDGYQIARNPLDPNIDKALFNYVENPELPERGQGVAPTEPLPRLTSPDVATMPEIGLTSEEAASVVKQTEVPTVAKAKSAIASHDQAVVDEANAKAKLAAEPKSSSEIPTLLVDPVAAKEPLKTALDEGANGTQAVSEVVQQQRTPEVLNARVKQKVAKESLRKLAKVRYAKQVEAGYAVVKHYTNALDLTLGTKNETPDSRVGSIITKALKAGFELEESGRPDEETGELTEGEGKTGKKGAIQDAAIQDRIASAVYKWAKGDYRGDTTPENLEGVLGQVLRNAKKKPTSDESYLVNGKRIYGVTKEEVDAKIAELEQDPSFAEGNWKAKASSEGRGWFIGRAKQAVSLQTHVGEEATLEEFISRDPRDIAVDNRPQVTKNTLLDIAVNLLKSPEDLADQVPNPENLSDEEHTQVVQDKLAVYIASESLKNEEEFGVATKSFLNELNSRLGAGGVAPVKSSEALQTLRADVQEWLNGFNKKYRSGAMGSTVPGDEGLARKMGLFGTVHDVLRWLSLQSQTMGLRAGLAKAWLDSGIFPDNVKLILPGHEDHNPTGTYMDVGVQVNGQDIIPPSINIAHYPPTDPAEFQTYVQQISEELAHMSEVRYERNPNAHPEYGQARQDFYLALRKSKLVPKKVRDAVEQSVKDGDYDVWRNVGLQESRDMLAKWKKMLGEHYSEWFQYFYAMQTRAEAVANTFTDPKLARLAAETSMPSKGILDTALTFLSRMYNKFVMGGRGEDNALAQLLAAHDRYLTSGILRKTYAGSDFIRDSLVAKGVMPDALALEMQIVDRTFARGTLEASLTGFKTAQENGLLHSMVAKGEVNPDVDAALRSGKTGDVADHVENLLAPALRFHADLSRWLQKHIDITKSLLTEVKAGRVPGSVPPNLEENLRISQAKLNAMHKELGKQARALEAFNQLNNFDLEGFEQNLADQITSPRIYRSAPAEQVPDSNEVRQNVAVERLVGGGISPIWKWFGLTPHLKEVVPSSKPVFNGTRDEQGLSIQRLRMLHTAGIFNSDTGTSDTAIAKSNNRVAQNQTMMTAASDIMRYQNKEGQMQLVDLKAPFVKKTLEFFKQSDRDAILQVVKTIQLEHQHYTEHWLPSTMGTINRDNTAILLTSKEPGMLPDQARSIASDIYEGLTKLVDPTQSVLGQALLQKVSSQISPDAYVAALSHAQAISQATAKWIQSVRNNPGFVTEQRYGKDQAVLAGPQGERARVDGSTDAVKKKVAEKQAQGYSLLDYIKAGDIRNPNASISDEHLAGLQEIQDRNVQAVQQVLSNDPTTAQTVLARMDMVGDLRAQIAASSPLPTVHRDFVEGRESINMVANADQFYSRMNNYFRVRSTRARTALDMMHPEIAGNREVTNLLNDHVNNFLTPDNPIVSKLTKILYFYKLGFDMGQAMLEGTQNMTTGMTSLIGETGSVSDAFSYWSKAIKDGIAHRATGKWSDSEVERLMTQAEQRGHLGDIAGWSDFHNEEANTVYDNAAGALAKAFSPVKNAARSLFSISTRINDSIGLRSAFALAKERGMSFDEAYDFALDVKNRGYFNGGKAQRSVGLWSIQTKAVPQLLATLQTYSQGWFSQLAEQFQKGFGKAPPGLSDVQRVGAKKAFLYSIASQAALAGVLGLPGAGQGIALLNQATGVDVKGWLRQNLSKMFDEDQTYGGVLTSLALRGVGAAGLPFDPSSRMSISIPFLGVDAYKGFNVANLGGPVTSTAADFVGGMLDMLHGNPAGAEKVLPNVLKRPLALWLGDGDIRDQRGALQIELSPSERFMMAVGVTPTRVQTQRDISEAVKKANQDALKEKEGFADTLAKQVRTGDVARVQQQVQQYVSQHPETTAKGLIQEIAARVEAETFPFDPRREVQPGVDLSGFPSPYPGQEAVRQSLRQNVQSSLGMFPHVGFNAKSMFRSSQEDSAMTANPTLSRSAAVRQTSPSLTTRPTPALPSPYSWLSSGATPAVFQ